METELDLNEIRAKLVARRQELTETLTRLTESSRDSATAEVQDEIDKVNSDEAKTAALDVSTIEYQALRDVQEALVRLDNGEYGTCVICGRPIEPVRLRAIPETPFCLEHAEEAARSAASQAG